MNLISGILLVGVLTMSGCSSIKKLDIFTMEVDREPLALEKPKLIEKIVNRGSERATRCVEIAGGSPLTEKELLATKKSEINTECPSIANPNYEPY